MNTETLFRAKEIEKEIIQLAAIRDRAENLSDKTIGNGYTNSITFQNAGSGNTFNFDTNNQSPAIVDILNDSLQSCLTTISAKAAKRIKKLEKEFEAL